MVRVERDAGAAGEEQPRFVGRAGELLLAEEPERRRADVDGALTGARLRTRPLAVLGLAGDRDRSRTRSRRRGRAAR